jgi:hypothetical protein
MSRRLLFILAVALPMIGVLGYIDTHFFALADSWDRWKWKRWENDYRGGYLEGRELAAMDLQVGHTNYCTQGLLRPGATYNGLPVITTGCVVRRRDEGFADGYNLEVDKALQRTNK